MEYIYVGKITNTHGLKGEIRILSNFKYKESIMIPGFSLYIGDDYQQVIIKTHRIHKNYNMVVFDGYDTIESVLPWKGKSVYIKREDLIIDEYFDEDYIGLKAYSDRYLGEVVDILSSSAHDILVIENNQKKYLVPKIDVFIKKIDLKEQKIFINEIEGLFDEN